MTSHLCHNYVSAMFSNPVSTYVSILCCCVQFSICCISITNTSITISESTLQYYGTEANHTAQLKPPQTAYMQIPRASTVMVIFTYMYVMLSKKQFESAPLYL